MRPQVFHEAYNDIALELDYIRVWPIATHHEVLVPQSGLAGDTLVPGRWTLCEQQTQAQSQIQKHGSSQLDAESPVY